MEMIGFKNLLVAIDGSDESMKALEVATSLAKKYDGWLTALYIIRFPIIGLPGAAISSEIFLEEARKAAKEWLAEIQRKGMENDIKIETRVVESFRSEYTEIVAYADSAKADLIVMGSRGRSGFKKLLLGSVASGVTTYASCPVLVVK